VSKANRIFARTILIVFILITALELSAVIIAAQASPLRLVTSSQATTESTDPAAILSAARLLYVHSQTGLVKSEVIESELQKRSELQQAGLLLTRDPNAADLRMEVRRSIFTTEYPYVVINTKTQIVVASGKVNSLFGTAAAKIAKGFAKQLKKARNPTAKTDK
jgi:hypothetical protein